MTATPSGKSGKPGSVPHKEKKTKTVSRTSTSSHQEDLRKRFSHDKNKKPEALLHKELAGTLIKYSYYHGCMPREECEEMLKQEGNFLLRVTTLEDEDGGGKSETHADKFVISVLHEGVPRHLRINVVNNEFKIAKVKKPSISELIDHLRDNKHPLPTGAILISGVPRPEYYILHENVHIFQDKKLGEGNFGCVYQGLFTPDEQTRILCAIKTCKKAVSKKERCNFIREARTMRRLDHTNIVRFYGVAAQEMPIMLLMEFCPKGSLQSHCAKNPHLSDKQLLAWVIDAARGMCYLHRCNVMHLDLAARNCLLGANIELKISDFGKSEADQSSILKDRLEGFATKWMPPEVLTQGRITPKCDVWSYGVTTWEIYMRCAEEPYKDVSKRTVRSKVQHEGCTLKIPPICPLNVQEVLKKCWNPIPEERPDFDMLLKTLSPDEQPPVGCQTEGGHKSL